MSAFTRLRAPNVSGRGWIFGALVVVLIASSLLHGGCASTAGRRTAARLERPADCGGFFTALHKVAAEEKARDTSSFSIPGFPHLRTNRFLTALGPRLETPGARSAWLEQLESLGRKAVRKEIGGLSERAVGELSSLTGAKGGRQGLIATGLRCGEELTRLEPGMEAFYPLLFEALPRPTEYSFFLRTVGLYPLTSLVVLYATNGKYNEFREWRTVEPSDLPLSGTLETYAPPPVKNGGDLSSLLDGSRSNPLNVPLPTDDEAALLAAGYGPMIVQDTAAPYDRPGRVVWKNGSVEIDTERPTVYYYLTYAFKEDLPVLQLNYAFWYTARDGPLSPWIEKGSIDGLTVRVSLNRDGTPFMVDVMNSCGCYHFFAPTKKSVASAIPKWGLDPFVPQWLPENFSGRSTALRLNSGWHQVLRIDESTPAAGSRAYELLPYAVLEELPDGEGKRRSIFDENGIFRGSYRIEPYILFPMGVYDIGSMRQRGHHPITLVGRRAHFDDPELFNRNFVFR